MSVVVLTLNEEPNIRRCLASVAWAHQVVVVDSGSADRTVPLARATGAEVVDQPWLGFSAQREFALRLPLRHDWVYFVDADEWVSPQLAGEIAAQLADPQCAGFAQRFRLVFLDTWIRHCGWYRGSWIVRLVDRRYTKYEGSLVGERACVDGRVQRLSNDIVDEDRKGLAAWLHKHVRYAQLECVRRESTANLPERIRVLRQGRGTRPLARSILKDLVFPIVPAKPAALFFYMYIARLGFLDGVAGLRFCFYHAWFEMSVAALRADARRSGGTAKRDTCTTPGPSPISCPSAARFATLPRYAGWQRWRPTRRSDRAGDPFTRGLNLVALPCRWVRRRSSSLWTGLITSTASGSRAPRRRDGRTRR